MYCVPLAGQDPPERPGGSSCLCRETAASAYERPRSNAQSSLCPEFDYTNPKSRPQWLPSSHDIDREVQRMDEEAVLGLGNIKREVERRDNRRTESAVQAVNTHREPTSMSEAGAVLALQLRECVSGSDGRRVGRDAR